MTTNQRGCVSLLGFLVFVFFGCILFPFILLPQAGTAVTLPVISVPAEYYLKDWPSKDFTIVNSLGGALMATIIVLLIAVFARRASNNWTREVPTRFQGMVEVIVGGLWGLTQSQAGNKPKVRNLLFPLVASLFLYLLAGNWGKLLPGVETVGVLHCAAYEPVAFNGFPVQETSAFGRPYFVLRSEAPLNTGIAGTYESYHRCEAMLGITKYAKYLPTELDPFLDKAVLHTVAEGDTLASIAAKYTAQAQEIAQGELPKLSEYVTVNYSGWQSLTFTPEMIVAANTSGGTVNIKAASGTAKPAEDGHGDGGHSKPNLNAIQAEGTATPEPAHGDAHSEETHGEAAAVAMGGLTADTPLEVGQTIVVRPERLGYDATTFHNQLFTVAPFVRGMATDLSFTLGLAILAFLVIQAFGVSELGLDYFQKFINVRAIGNVGKKPLGVIDFVVGIFEIVSELGKIISLSFRLFGAIFAGTVLFAVIMFLTGTTIPAVILLLEIIVGGAQAGVFAILTLIFSAQAMVSHHHDEEHEHGEHAEAHH